MENIKVKHADVELLGSGFASSERKFFCSFGKFFVRLEIFTHSKIIATISEIVRVKPPLLWDMLPFLNNVGKRENIFNSANL